MIQIGDRRISENFFKDGVELKMKYVSLDDVENFEALTMLQKYDIAIQRIAAEAPVRICEGEKLSGAATLGGAIYHMVPAAYQDKMLCRSVSHLTVDFGTVLKKVLMRSKKT